MEPQKGPTILDLIFLGDPCLLVEKVYFITLKRGRCVALLDVGLRVSIAVGVGWGDEKVI